MKKKEIPYKIIYSEIYEEIYELRKTGLSYQGIAKHFHEHGIKINEREIEGVCREIFNEKGEKQPKGRKIPHEKSERQKKIYEKIRELRNNGLSFKDIITYFRNFGIKIEVSQIREAIREASQSIEEKESEYDEKWIREKIYELREKELSYEKIAEYFEHIGIVMSEKKVSKICKEIYAEKGKEEPNIKYEFPKRKSPLVSDEVIYILRKKNWSYRKITIYLQRKGIKVTEAYIAKRSKEIFIERGEEEPETEKYNPHAGKTVLDEVKEQENLEKGFRELFEQTEQTAAVVEVFQELDENRNDDEER